MKILTILKKKILILTGPYFLMPQPENRVSYTTSHTLLLLEVSSLSLD